MASTTSTINQREFELFFRDAPAAGLASLNSQFAGHDALRRLADVAGQRVNLLEDYLNRKNTVCVPVHVDVGRDDVHPSLDGSRNRYALGVTKVGSTWRVLTYRWVYYGGEHNDSRGWSAPIITPWLEAPVAERIMTMRSLPKLCDALCNAASGLMRVGSTCEPAVRELAEKVKGLGEADPMRFLHY